MVFVCAYIKVIEHIVKHIIIGLGLKSQFWCLLPVQVRTNEQTYRETYREVRHGYCGTDDEAAKIQKGHFS